MPKAKKFCGAFKQCKSKPIETKPQCDITGCTKDGLTYGCCNKRLCSECAFNITRFCACYKRFMFKCPFCRQGVHIPEKI